MLRPIGLALRAPARHHEADFLDVGACRFDFTGNLSVIEHEKTVGEGGNLLEFRRNQEHGTSGIPKGDKFSMNEFDGTDVDATRRLRDEQQFWRQSELPADDKLLLISAGKRSCRKIGL